MNRATLEGVAIAVSSPPGRGARGLLRATGDGLLEHLDAVLDEATIRLLASRQRHVCKARLSLPIGTVPCVVICLPGPRTFTGEDMLELELPGNPSLLAAAEVHLIAALESEGIDAHPAVAGEFTARAFLNGRISLLEAEHVAASIAASNQHDLDAVNRLRESPLLKETKDLCTVLTSILGRVEAAIDFSDEADVVAITGNTLQNELLEVTHRLETMLDVDVAHEAPQEHARIVLVGPPNAGKSTLFNRLVGRDRMVVTDIPGTTRDAPSERISLGNRDAMLFDTAGLDQSLPSEGIHAATQDATRAAFNAASVILACSSADGPLFLPPDGGNAITVRTKGDLLPHGATPPEGLVISAVRGDGIDHLKAAIAERLDATSEHGIVASTALLPRHRDELSAANAAIDDALVALSSGIPQREVVAEVLRLALDHLAALEGGHDPEAVLDVVFSSFCIGK